jgi:hypothetical protein
MPQLANIPWLAVIVATLIAFVIGAVYYTTLGKRWMKAAGIEAKPGAKINPMLFVNSLVFEFIMATMTSGVLFHIYASGVTLRLGLISGFLLWLGFILPTLAINQRYQGFGWDLTLIDVIHWLLVMLAIGGTIGFIGM